MNYSNIPNELKERKQWSYSNLDPTHKSNSDESPKRPRNPKTKQNAMPNNPSTWGTFDEACKAALTCGKHGAIGYMLDPNDPYCVVDLDNHDEQIPQQKEALFNRVIGMFSNTYIETSSSGKGVHIVCQANSRKGKRKNDVEIYSKERYIIFTGNKISNSTSIANHESTVQQLLTEMGAVENKVTKIESQQETIGDQEILDLAANAPNSEEFLKLCQGKWQGDYQSQSEADLALFNHLAFYSRNDKQVVRMFMRSGLFREGKQHTYKYNLTKARDLQLPAIPLERFVKKTSQLAPNAQQPPTLTHTPKQPFKLPPGRLGVLTGYIYNSAQRPFYEIAVGAAIALSAGILGRSFSVSGTGLNHYVIVLAGTGRGKEAGASGINRLLASVAMRCPQGRKHVGPGHFASGQALWKHVAENPCFVSVLGEFGLTLQSICSKKANSAELMLKKVLTDAYNKSGPYDVLSGMAYSNKEDNADAIHSPNISILGEGTPSTFFEGLTTDHIEDGFIPRFTMLVYKGIRVARNPNANMLPTKEVEDVVASMLDVGAATMMNNTSHSVGVTPDALKLLDAFDIEATANINEKGASLAHCEIWNRSHVKALKLAGLLAAVDNLSNPIINVEFAEYAIWFTRREIGMLDIEISDGELDNYEEKCVSYVLKQINKFETVGDNIKESFRLSKPLWGTNVISLTYLSNKTKRIACFKNHRLGGKRALADALDLLIDRGEIVELDKTLVNDKFGLRVRCFTKI